MTISTQEQTIGALLLSAFAEIGRQAVTIEELYTYIVKRDGQCPFSFEEIESWFDSGDWMKQ